MFIYIYMCIHIYIYIFREREAVRQTGRQADRISDRCTGMREKNIKTKTHTNNKLILLIKMIILNRNLT